MNSKLSPDQSLLAVSHVIGDKWSLLIIRDAFCGFNRFSEFQKSLGVSKTVLSARLLSLSQQEILLRKQNKLAVDRYRYELSAKGLAMLPAIVALLEWEQKYLLPSASNSSDVNYAKALQITQKSGAKTVN